MPRRNRRAKITNGKRPRTDVERETKKAEVQPRKERTQRNRER